MRADGTGNEILLVAKTAFETGNVQLSCALTLAIVRDAIVILVFGNRFRFFWPIHIKFFPPYFRLI